MQFFLEKNAMLANRMHYTYDIVFLSNLQSSPSSPSSTSRTLRASPRPLCRGKASSTLTTSVRTDFCGLVWRTVCILRSVNNRNGTCYSSTDCNNRGGSASGGCAAGSDLFIVVIVVAASPFCHSCGQLWWSRYFSTPFYSHICTT